jgi:hypothetical protein
MYRGTNECTDLHTQQRAQTTKTAVFNLLMATKPKVPRLVFGFADFHKHNTLLHSKNHEFLRLFLHRGALSLQECYMMYI